MEEGVANTYHARRGRDVPQLACPSHPLPCDGLNREHVRDVAGTVRAVLAGLSITSQPRRRDSKRSVSLSARWDSDFLARRQVAFSLGREKDHEGASSCRTRAAIWVWELFPLNRRAHERDQTYISRFGTR